MIHFKETSKIAHGLLALLLMVLLTFGVLADSVSAADAANNKVKLTKGVDVRMLIDISGSMKKNDPNNLRIPAVNLLTELIPDGTKAGVWTFGQAVNNLIPHLAVDDKWRVSAKQKAKQINSVALYTNIGAVLEKASADFKKGQDFSNTHFLLLTDGMVDIDRDPEVNSKERDRILTEVVKAIADKGAKIHTISLSKNADSALMDKLAIKTGGQSAIAETSEDLTRIFLQALDQAVPSEQVPIEGNEFAIDSSVEEFTALIFRNAGAMPTEIIGPDAVVQKVGAHSPEVNWYQDQGYDLITVNRPLEGTWVIKADIQPDSRVTVVSDLKLEVTKLPTNFFAGEPLNVEVRFVDEGKVVSNKDFLSLLEVTLSLKTEDGKQGNKIISDPANPPADGVYRDAIKKLVDVGQYEFTVLVDGKTFKRKNRQIINLRSPFDVELSVQGSGEQAHYELVVSPLTKNIAVEGVSAFAKIKAPDSSSEVKTMELDKTTSRWILPVTAEKGDGNYKVAVKVTGTDNDGQPLSFSPKIFEAEFPIPAAAVSKIVSVNEPSTEPDHSEAVKPEHEVAALPPDEKALPPVTEPEVLEPAHPADAKPSIKVYAAIGGALMGLVLLVSGLTYYLIRKRRNRLNQQGEVLSDEVVEEIMADDPEPNDELDFVEEPKASKSKSAPPIDEPDDEPADGGLDDVMGGLGSIDEPEEPAPALVEDEEEVASNIAQAIEEAADEPEVQLEKEEEQALDINESKEAEEDEDEEFNLEDFDIGDTDDLPDDKGKK